MELSSSSRYHPQLFSLISPLGRRQERALKGALTINNFSFCQGMEFLILITVYNYNFWIYGTKTGESYQLLRRGHFQTPPFSSLRTIQKKPFTDGQFILSL